MKSKLSKFFKAGEFKLTLVSFLYFFFVISSYYMLKPVRDSLALEFGSKNINILNILSMVSLIAVNAFYSVIVGKYKRDIFIPYITKFFVGCIFVFWLVFTFGLPINAGASEVGEAVSVLERMGWAKMLCYGGYYLWVNIFSLIAVCMFWSFMNDVFSVEQGKRLYAYIGYGGLTGGAVGSAATKHLVQALGTQNILLVAIALLYPSIWCMHYVHNRYCPGGIVEEVGKPAEPAHPPSPVDGFWSVTKNFILILMALEMFFYTCSTTFFSQQMNHLIETLIPLGDFETLADARTAFIANIYGWVNFVSLVAQLVVTQLIMLFKNPIYGLLILNIIQVVGNLLLLTPKFGASAYALTVVSWTFILRRALDYSTARVLRESIYIPLDREAKYQGKGFIDTVVFRFGDGISSIMLFGGMSFVGYGAWIDYSILFVMALQFYVIIKIAKLYGQRVKGPANPLVTTASST
jgi:AAA family ATP:ADP antiporter